MAGPNFFGNWKVVLLSFLGATTFWFFSALGKNYNSRINFPIEFQFDRDSLIAVQPLPSEVEIDVSGGGWDLFRETFWFGSDPIEIELDNPTSIRFLTRATILPIISDQLSEYRINFLYTDTLFLKIEEKSSRVVSLAVDSMLVDMDEDHRIVSSISVMTDTAIIYGPKSFLDTLQNPFSIKLEASDIDKSFDRYVKLGLPEKLEIRSEPPTVQVQFEVDRFDRLTLDSEVEPMNFPDDSSAYLKNAKVQVRFLVQNSLRKKYFAEDFKVVVDYSMASPADSLAPVLILFHPEEALEVETLPDSLVVSYRNP